MTLVFAANSTQALWYLTRAGGAVLLVLLTASVVLGVFEGVRWSAPPHWPRFVVDSLHRNVSLLVLAVLALHVLTAVIDTFAPINLIDAFVPFVSRYRPVWVGLGALASDLLLAVAFTSIARQRLGFRAWRAIHWLSYACWPLAVVHGFGAGSDAKLAWMLMLAAACVAAVVIAVAWRALAGWPRRREVRIAALGATVAAPLALVVWLSSGPLAHGWARRAGTPAQLLAATSGVASSRPASTGSPARQGALRAPFDAQLSGTVRQGTNADGTLAVIQIVATMNGGASGRLTTTISGAPAAGGGVAMSSSQVALGPPSAPTQYRGRITSLAGTSFTGRLVSARGGAIDVRADLQLGAGGSVTGTLRATRAGGGGR